MRRLGFNTIFLISVIVIGFLFFRLANNYKSRFEEVEEAYETKTAINLAKGIDEDKLSKILLDYGYCLDVADADFVAKVLADKLNAGVKLVTLSDLKKLKWQASADIVDSIGSVFFKNKLEKARENLGWTKDIGDLYKDSALGAEKVIDTNKTASIKVQVLVVDSNVAWFKRQLKKNKKFSANTIVRLQEYYVDEQGKGQHRDPHYLKTDATGQVIFKGLNDSSYYSVLPIYFVGIGMEEGCDFLIKEGFDWGRPKGTVGEKNIQKFKQEGSLDVQFSLKEKKELKVRLFDDATLRRIKEEHTLTLRTPTMYKEELVKYLVLFFFAWGGLFFIVRSKNKNADTRIISALMLLTGLNLLIMFSLNDPLEEEVYGMDWGILGGVCVACVLQYVNFEKFYQNKYKVDFEIGFEVVKWMGKLFAWFLKPFRRKVSTLADILVDKKAGLLKKLLALSGIICCLPLLVLDICMLTCIYQSCEKKALACAQKRAKKRQTEHSRFRDTYKGISYLLVAIVLTLLLFPFGKEIGGMKVNLGIGGLTFQPSEITKYLMVFFMAAFFCIRAAGIVKYSEEGNLSLTGHKIRMLFPVIAGLGCLTLLYLILGDMGPAMVLAFTFIILYSVIKSKVSIEGCNEDTALKRILSCDLAMLFYGVVSFLLSLFIGMCLGNMSVFCGLWFAVWILMGILKKQVFESALLFNMIIVIFIFGGSILRSTHLSALDAVADRLEQRNEMSMNVWGDLGLDGGHMRPGVNTQLADGLWAVATGGLWGQGLGDGTPSLIPAFYTDMILESISEQLGFVGILAVVLLLAFILRRSILIGYQSSHTFVFYLCMGIAVVTGVQFFIIALGSTGIIPLTGVTVPFLSYGKVSMILNLAAFGVVISILSNNTGKETETQRLRRRKMGHYNYTVSILSIMYRLLSCLVLLVFFNYAFLKRNKVLIRPVYIQTEQGVPAISYNPRIDLLSRKLYAGDIYDRKGVLLATSDKAKLSQKEYLSVYGKNNLELDTVRGWQRYYPYGRHLYFMLGDYNTKLYFSAYGDKNPRGYMAEARHLATLRGYDNVLRTKEDKPIKVDLYSDTYSPDRYFPHSYRIEEKGVQLRDYRPLLPYLKAGINSRKVRRMNARKEPFWTIGKIKPKDLHLTIDASLQTELQKRMAKFAENNYSGRNKLRMSIVVLDAEHGDLLASANYPLPDYKVLENVLDNYSDYYKDAEWKAYTDRDLGLTNPTPPGSTAKVISSLAGLRKLGVACADPTNPRYTYSVYEEDIVGVEPFGDITMEEAIVKSSNCYFINLVNDNDLYRALGFVYATVGIQLAGKMLYSLHYTQVDRDWVNWVDEKSKGAVEKYRQYVMKKPKDRGKMRGAVWQWAWGQGDVWATPLTMARVASIVVNNGKMPVTRYLLDEVEESIPIVSKKAVKPLKEFMEEEALEHSHFSEDYIGGKTGTAERVIKNAKYQEGKSNDGWYICFIENAEIPKMIKNKTKVNKGALAIAVRIERLGGGRSGHAVRLTKEVVLEALKNLAYIENERMN